MEIKKSGKETDTPRTDAVEPQLHSNAGGWVKADFARQLERELAISLSNQVKTQTEVERLKGELERAIYGCGCDNYLQIYCDKHNPYNKTK